MKCPVGNQKIILIRHVFLKLNMDEVTSIWPLLEGFSLNVIFQEIFTKTYGSVNSVIRSVVDSPARISKVFRSAATATVVFQCSMSARQHNHRSTCKGGWSKSTVWWVRRWEVGARWCSEVKAARVRQRGWGNEGLHMVLGQFVICGLACGPHFARAWRYRCKK